MKRLILFASIGIGLTCFSGCNLLHKKHLRQTALVDGDACGCGASVPTSFEGVPSTGMISPAPIPFGGVPVAPQKSPFPSYQG